MLQAINISSIQNEQIVSVDMMPPPDCPLSIMLPFRRRRTQLPLEPADCRPSEGKDHQKMEERFAQLRAISTELQLARGSPEPES